MHVVKLTQLFDNRVGLLEGWMFHRLVASYALQRHSAKLLRRFDSAHAKMHAASQSPRPHVLDNRHSGKPGCRRYASARSGGGGWTAV